MYTAVELFHVYNSSKYGPAGGTVNLGHALLLMGQVAGMIAAALSVRRPGTQDLSSGVFRISSRPGAREHDCSWRGFRAGWRCYCR